MPLDFLYYLSSLLTNFILILITYPDIDECKDNPCKNGGACVNSPPGSYTCKCAEGYQGDHCQEGKIKFF